MPLTSHGRNSLSRCVALYPGAFRPPHAAHMAAVRYLVAQPGITEVAIIISNRCRPIPGTTKVLDAQVVKSVWMIYLQDMPNVRIEIADHTAVNHALEYFKQLEAGEMLLLCVGETDLQSGDDRFSAMENLSKHTGVAGKIMAVPTGSFTVRGTAMRQALAEGDDGQETFMAGLPSHLTSHQRATVWAECRAGMRDIGPVVQKKIERLLGRQGLGGFERIGSVKSGKVDQVFCARYSDGRRMFVKYAGDTAEAGQVGHPWRLKPRKRLAAERRALNALRTCKIADLDLPEVAHFDKATVLLVLTEVCPNGRSLEDNLRAGMFETSCAKRVGRFLARCHMVKEPLKPLWGREEVDLQQWKRMLDLRTKGADMVGLPDQVHQMLNALNEESDGAKRKGIFHLDVNPKNILMGDGTVGMIDWEMSSSVGDPAYDIGVFLGHYLLWGFITSSGHLCQQAIQAALYSYQQEFESGDVRLEGRIAAFAGATILSELGRSHEGDVRGFEEPLVNMATSLLMQGLRAKEALDHLLHDTLTRHRF